MAEVRVLRLLEYVYDSAEEALADMGRWQVPPSGQHRFGGPRGRLVRSAVLQPEVLEPVRD